MNERMYFTPHMVNVKERLQIIIDKDVVLFAPYMEAYLWPTPLMEPQYGGFSHDVLVYNYLQGSIVVVAV